jgi:excinuclease ABC subunit A
MTFDGSPNIPSSMQNNKIIIRGARVNNLKNINIDIPHNALVVITGLSGSGKSSLAFDTVYAEGHRRYVESLSSYARQFLEQISKPDVDKIEGLSPAIAIDQRNGSYSPRSTVGTATEIYDYFRLFFSKIGKPHCPKCGNSLQKLTPREITDRILNLKEGTELMLMAPVIREQKGDHKTLFDEIVKSRYFGARVDGIIYPLDEVRNLQIDHREKHNIDIVVQRIFVQQSTTYTDTLENLVRLSLDLGNGLITLLLSELERDITFSQSYQCNTCGVSMGDMEPKTFSFNSPQGACQKCTGLGTKMEIDPNLVITNPTLTLAQGAIKPWSRLAGSTQNGQMKILEKVAERYNFSLHVPVNELSEKHKEIIFQGTEDEVYELNGSQVPYEGVIANLERKYHSTDSEYMEQEMEGYMRVMICPDCEGKRLRPSSLAVTVQEKNIAYFVNLDLSDLSTVCQQIQSDLQGAEKMIAEPILKEILRRIGHLLEIGLHYLTLDRTIVSLSGGESQRLRLATQIGSSLTGVIYILDEPSIGLHPKDVNQLIKTLKHLRDMDNTVIVVEHDKSIMEAADHIIDVGPGAGLYGGEIVAAGNPSELKKNKCSLTGQYLSGKMEIEIKAKCRKGNRKILQIIGAEEYNLKKIHVKIPLGKFICITGVSGSGKSTLMTDILAKSLSHHFYKTKDLPGKHKEIRGIENIDKVITIDQSPIGKTPRSNPATYTGVFTYIRDLFTQIPEAKIRGFDAGKFSFNVKGGRCETCVGEGFMRIEMKFLPDVFVPCEQCHGRRYVKEALEIYYHGKNIADVLEMSVTESKDFFKETPIIYEKLNILDEVGLGYIKLGQSATTLSGGEAQRVKLATELSRRSTGKTLYILDEPTTGLHFEDIRKLLAVLNRLVDKGETVLVIEHNLDVIKSADWIIDMGPEGGKKGGYIIAEGTPKDVAKVKKSYTGQFLKEILKEPSPNTQ